MQMFIPTKSNVHPNFPSLVIVTRGHVQGCTMRGLVALRFVMAQPPGGTQTALSPHPEEGQRGAGTPRGGAKVGGG